MKGSRRVRRPYGGRFCARLEESARIVRLKVRLRNVKVAAARRDGETHAGVGNTLCRNACWDGTFP